MDDSLSRSLTGSGRDLSLHDASDASASLEPSSSDDEKGVFEAPVSFRVRRMPSLQSVKESGAVPGRVLKCMSLGSLEFVTQQVHHADEVTLDHTSIARKSSRKTKRKRSKRASVKARIQSLIRSVVSPKEAAPSSTYETKGQEEDDEDTDSDGDGAWATRTRRRSSAPAVNTAGLDTLDAPPSLTSPDAAVRLASPWQSSGGTPGSVFSFVEDN